MKAVFTIEQIDGKMVVTVEAAEIVVKQQEKYSLNVSKKDIELANPPLTSIVEYDPK
jgi:hypothetical protein